MQVENNPLSDQITRIVESSTGKLVVSAATLAGGFADAKHVVLSDGSQVVVKLSKDASGDLAVEGATMDYLKHHTQLPMPELFYSGQDALVHEYIVADGTLSVDSEPEAAEHLAKLHAVSSDFSDLITIRCAAASDNLIRKPKNGCRFLRSTGCCIWRDRLWNPEICPLK